MKNETTTTLADSLNALFNAPPSGSTEASRPAPGPRRLRLERTEDGGLEVRPKTAEDQLTVGVEAPFWMPG